MKKLMKLFLTIAPVLFAYSINGQNFVDVNKGNSGQTINLNNDQVLQVKLPKTPSNGYTWCESVATDKTVQQSIARIGDDEFIQDPIPANRLNSKGRTVGQSGTIIYRYVGTSVGTTQITLELRRPWVKDVPATDVFTIIVVSSGKYTGTYTPPVKPTATYRKTLTSVSSTLPSDYDWRSQCTPIANQMQCGDCWAFASCGTLECNILIHDGGVPKDISEEFVTNCFTDFGSGGCGGGNCAHEAWLKSYTGANSNGGGAVYESEDAWTTSEGNGTTGSCGGTYVTHETIDSYRDIGGEDANGVPPIDSIKNAIYKYGPIWIAVDAASNGWSNYNGGIWIESGTSTDHAVCLVGWRDTTTGALSDGSTGYWILRNSWGTGWGVGGTGYMYISYKSDAVGCDADYLVYKGGVPHNVPPVAMFAANDTANCTGVIQFNDNSLNSPTSWHWNFGDGDTSNVQNPLHVYNASGTYTVTLKATNTYGNNSATKTSYITINLETAPTGTGATCSGPCSDVLNASGSGVLNWYSAETGGLLLGQGTSYTTPTLDTTTTYYVQDSIPGTFIYAAKAAKGTGGYHSSGTHYLIFNCTAAVTLDSVTIYGNSVAPGSRTVSLLNSSGTTLQSTSLNVLAGKHEYYLGFSLPVGTSLRLECSEGTNVFRDSSGFTYPITSTDISITGTDAGSTLRYYYFYNWKLQLSSSCLSPRVPVVATVTTITGIKENSASEIGVYPNPSTGNFEVTLNNIGDATITMVNVLGQTVLQQKVNNSNAPIQINASNFEDGLYYIKVQTENSTYTKKVIIDKK